MIFLRRFLTVKESFCRNLRVGQFGRGPSCVALVLPILMLNFSNPLLDRNLADPFIYHAEGYFFLIATGAADDGRFLPIFRSKDFVDWEFIRGAVERGTEGAWNRKNFWAPEVVEIGGMYHLYYTGCADGLPGNEGNRVGLAISNSPEGPFEDVGVVVSTPSLDGSAWQDTDGQWYLYYVVEFGDPDGKTPGQIYVDRMPDPKSVEGKPKRIIDWHGWQEGPFVVKEGGLYYLTFSINGWKTDRYQVRFATSSSPTGPFHEPEEGNPILSSNENVKGPGHHMFFRDGNDDWWIVYHGWNSKFTARYPRADRSQIGNGTITVDGPTETPLRSPAKKIKNTRADHLESRRE